MLRIGILGGTFDPIHKGHISMACSALKHLFLDKVILQPNKIPYYKSTPSVSDNDRLEMVKLAALGLDNIEVSDYELTQPEYTYTYNNLVEFRKKHPNDAIYFIMGMDSLFSLHKWYKGNEILNLAHIIVIGRPGNNLDAKLKEEGSETVAIYKTHFKELPKSKSPKSLTNSLGQNENNYLSDNELNGHLYIINCDLVDISSSELRATLKELNTSISATNLKYLLRNDKESPNLQNIQNLQNQLDKDSNNNDKLAYIKKYLNDDILQYIADNGLYTE